MSEIEHKLSELDAIEGSGTTLVSLYVPSDKSLLNVRSRLASEQDQARNIKSQDTRERVQRALTMLQHELQSVPDDTSFVGFAGLDTDGEEHVASFVDVPVDSFRYHCDKQFLTDPLRNVVADHDTYALVVIERREATIGKLVGDRVEHCRDFQSDAKGKHNAGGFSNRRFDRVIEESTTKFYENVAHELTTTFDPDELSGVIVGGTNITRNEFTDHIRYPLDEMVLGTYAVEYTGRSGLEELVRRADEAIDRASEATPRRVLDEFFTGLRGDHPVEYGLDQTATAAQLGAVETLLIESSRRYDEDAYREVTETIEAMGGDVVEIDPTFEDAERFVAMSDGIGALLRYPVRQV